MAEAFFNSMAGDKASASSAGTQPASKINPTVVEAMREVGLDVSRKVPKLLTPQMMEDADRVFTMGCSAEKVCPAVFVSMEDWQLADPEGQPIEEVRRIRDDIKNRVMKLIKEL
jgi:protein-tyrosine-phosphatase